VHRKGEAIVSHVQQHFIPYGLLAVIAVSVVNPSLGLKLHALKVHRLSAPGIFLISGLLLKLEEVQQAVRSPLPLIVGYCVILFLLPLSAFSAIRWPYLPADLVYGIAVYLCMPTALSTGVQLCTRNGGNPALALLLTVGSNLAAILTIPVLATRLFGGVHLHLDAVALLQTLTKTILLPLLLGMGLKAKVRSVASFVKANAKGLSLLSGVLLVLVPLAELGVALSGNAPRPEPGHLAQLVALGLAFPALFLSCNTLLVRRLTAWKPQVMTDDVQRTLVIVCSLKTLPLAVMVMQKVQELLPSQALNAGIALLPCIAFHLLQVILVSVVASNWQSPEPATTVKE